MLNPKLTFLVKLSLENISSELSSKIVKFHLISVANIKTRKNKYYLKTEF